MRTPPPLYDHLFKGKKMAGMAGEIRQLWLAPRSPHESPLERATQELQVCRKLRAYHELILNREAQYPVTRATAAEEPSFFFYQCGRM